MSKLSPISRVLIAAASMPPQDARRLLGLICGSGMTTSGDRAAQVRSKRAQMAFKCQSAINRQLDHAKNETIRNLEHYHRVNAPKPVESAQGDQPDPVAAAQILFDKNRFGTELLTALRDESYSALSAAGNQLFDELGKDNPFLMPANDALRFLQDRTNLLSGVSDEIYDQINSALQKGLARGDSLLQLTRRVETAFEDVKKGRAKTIADTETAAAFGYARNNAMQQAGVKFKKWRHTHIPKEPRPDHLEIDGMTVRFDEPFPVGNPRLMYPHDSNGSAEDVINCRCLMIPMEHQ